MAAGTQRLLCVAARQDTKRGLWGGARWQSSLLPAQCLSFTAPGLAAGQADEFCCCLFKQGVQRCTWLF